MRKNWLKIVIATAALLCASPSFAQSVATNSVPGTSEDIQQCIRDNAPKVEQSISSLTEGVNFLVSDICAVPVAQEMGRQQDAMMASMREASKRQCEAQKAAGKQDAKPTDEPDPCAAMDAVYASSAVSGWTMYSAGLNKPAAPTAFAAQLLLNLRVSHMTANHN
jgi:hypothetical protein